jgi:hypothetical protein
MNYCPYPIPKTAVKAGNADDTSGTGLWPVMPSLKSLCHRVKEMAGRARPTWECDPAGHKLEDCATYDWCVRRTLRESRTPPEFFVRQQPRLLMEAGFIMFFPRK